MIPLHPALYETEVAQEIARSLLRLLWRMD